MSGQARVVKVVAQNPQVIGIRLGDNCPGFICVIIPVGLLARQIAVGLDQRGLDLQPAADEIKIRRQIFVVADEIQAEPVFCEANETVLRTEMQPFPDVAPVDPSSSSGHNSIIRHDVTCRQLVWGRSLDQFVSEHGLFDIVLGSDIIYVPEIIGPLFETIERIMTDDATFILAYARRNVPIDLVLDHAKQKGFVWTCPDESAEGVFCFKRATRREG